MLKASMGIEQHIFWTQLGPRDAPIPDPLGLDSLRENLSDRLVPDLTGRTRRAEDAFWSLVFLRWSHAALPEHRVRTFLQWERNLKLLWARLGCDSSVASPRTFTGIEQSRIQGKNGDAPCTRFIPLLKNQRAQGLLGAYSRMLIRLGLIDQGLEVTDLGEVWTEGAGDPPKLPEGQWRSWNAAFARAFLGFKSFRGRLREILRQRMPQLHLGLVKSRWNEDADWAAAARYMGPDRRWALFADRYCRWADRLRTAFDELVENPASNGIKLPGALKVPAKILRNLPWQHWPMVSRYNTAPSFRSKLVLLADWHWAELRSRGYGKPDLWLIQGPRRLEGRRYNASPRNNEGSDCRWANAVRMMRA